MTTPMVPEPLPLCLTLGDPAGIGPEIILKAWQALRDTGPKFFVIGDLVALGVDAHEIKAPAETHLRFKSSLPVLNLPLPEPARPGQPSLTAGKSIIQWIETGVRLVAEGEASGLVTAPIAKASLYAGGFKFPGHTEFLGDLTREVRHAGPRGPVMMLIAQDLRVALVTVHLPLAEVPNHITEAGIIHTAQVTAHALMQDFGIQAPRLAIAALNPHAGENGTIGREDIEIIAPAVAALKSQGLNVTGPAPSDSLFSPDMRSRYDAVICMYHDQALIPIKMLDFWGGVNVTLGLPIVRTSPDHGTAFDIVGQDIARPDSLIAAIKTAAALAARRAR